MFTNRGFTKISVILIVLTLCHAEAFAQRSPASASIDSYVQPYVQSGNFSGIVLVETDGKTVFQRAYGYANREKKVRNTTATRFHVGSVSMQFTAVGILRLVDQGAIKLNDHIGEYVPEIEGADKITIRELLVERSGLPDINAMPDYDEVLQHHQTAESLVAHIQGKPLQFEPGTKFVREEHSAYNLLALVIEKKTGMSFAEAMQRLVFAPFGLAHSGVDDDGAMAQEVAKGYAPEGTYGWKPATAIHWSAKTGNASAFTTASDEALWVRELFHGNEFSATSRDAVLDTSMKVGYGWMRGKNERFATTAYYMNGRAPGFASFVLYLPNHATMVVLFSNIYSSATTAMGYDIAAISLGLPYGRLQFARPSREELTNCAGDFQFGPDFYQPNARVAVRAQGEELFLEWPSGDRSALIPLGQDRFMDRSYWEEVRIERGDAGQPSALEYDRFRGKLVQ